MVQLKTVLLGVTSLFFLFDFADPLLAWTLLGGNVASIVFPKHFAKLVVFVGKRFVKI